jgi:hypothetical protein
MAGVVNAIVAVGQWVYGAVTATGFYGAVARAAFTALLSVAASKLFGPKVPSGELTGTQVMSRGALEYRKIVYGQAMVSGPVTYNNLSGEYGKYLWFVVALADGESEDITAVWFDGDPIPKADIDWTPGAGGADGTGTGNVTTAKWFNSDNSPGTAAAQIYYYLGHANQAASNALVTALADFNSSHRFRGVTYLVAKLLWSEETSRIWQHGAPSNIRVLVKGRKIYDPRLDSTVIIDPTTSPITYGSGSHRYTDSSTWEWSDNPALCVSDYLIRVMRVDASDSVDWVSVATSADFCEETVSIPGGTEKRFTCNGALSLGETHKDNLDSLLSSMDGKLSYTGGTWKVRPSMWEEPSVTITESDLCGTVEVQGSSPRSNRFNLVRGFFIDPNRGYEATEFPHVFDSEYIARDDNKTIPFDLQLPCTNTETMAQRIAFRNLEQSDNQTIVKLKMNARGMKVAIGDVVNLELSKFGWSSDSLALLLEDDDNLLLEDDSSESLLETSAKQFRCIEWAKLPDGKYDVTLKEDGELSYTDPSEADYDPSNTTGVTQPDDEIPPPTNLAAVGISTGVKLTWTNPSASVYDYINIYESSTNDWSTASLITQLRGTTYTVPHDDNTTYYYWARALREPNLFSDREPDLDASTVSAADTSAGDAEIIGIGGNAADSVVDPDNAQAAIQVNNDGDLYTRAGDLTPYVSAGTWLNGGTNSDYEYMMAGTGDTPTAGSLDTWISGATTTYWQLDEGTGGSEKEFNGTITWRSATTFEILASASVRIFARVTV